MSAPADMPTNNSVNGMQTSDDRRRVHHPVITAPYGKPALFTEL